VATKWQRSPRLPPQQGGEVPDHLQHEAEHEASYLRIEERPTEKGDETSASFDEEPGTQTSPALPLSGRSQRPLFLFGTPSRRSGSWKWSTGYARDTAMQEVRS